MVMLQTFFSAVALLLIFEGIIPFISPKFWRHMVQSFLKQSDNAMRVTGLFLMLCGLIILVIIKFTFGIN